MITIKLDGEVWGVGELPGQYISKYSISADIEKIIPEDKPGNIVEIIYKERSVEMPKEVFDCLFCTYALLRAVARGYVIEQLDPIVQKALHWSSPGMIFASLGCIDAEPLKWRKKKIKEEVEDKGDWRT